MSRRAGLRRKRLILQKRVGTSTDAEGATSDNWAPVGSIWAQVVPIAGVEALVAGQPESRITHQVNTDYRLDLALASSTPTPNEGHNMRLLLGSRILDILTVADRDERHAELDLLCIERQR